MFDLLKDTIEYRQLGWNMATFSGLGTIGFTVWQMTALVHQYHNIKTGESVSVSWHTYFTADFMAFLVYGVYAGSITMTLNAFLGFGHLLVLWGLRVKNFSMLERLLLPTIVLFPIVMYFSRTHSIDLGFVEFSERQFVFLIFSCGTLIALGQQPWEMWKSKSCGDFSFNLLISYTASTGFWLVFAFVGTDDIVLRLLTSVGTVEMSLCCFLWHKFKT